MTIFSEFKNLKTITLNIFNRYVCSLVLSYLSQFCKSFPDASGRNTSRSQIAHERKKIDICGTSVGRSACEPNFIGRAP